MGMSFIKLLIARVKSKSPRFYVTCRWIAGMLAFCAALVLGLVKGHVIVLAPDVATEVMNWCEQIGSGLSGIFLFTWTGTTDATLLEKPEGYN